MHQASSDEVNMFAEVGLGFILVDDSLPTDMINTFPNQKPWEDKTIHEGLEGCSAVHNSGLGSRRSTRECPMA